MLYMKNLRKKIVKFYKNLLYIFIGYPLYFISFLFKRDRKLWVISGPFGFRDNSKYFAIYLFEQNINVNCFWVAKNKQEMLEVQRIGIPVVRRWSFKGVYYCLRAKVYIFDSYVTDINLWTSGGAYKVNLWHGIGIKNIERKARIGVTRKIFSGNQFLKRFIYPAHYIKPNMFLSTSQLMTEHFSESFGIKKSDCIEAVYPRCQVFFWDDLKLGKHIQVYESEEMRRFLSKLKKYTHSFIYMPTWRDSNDDFLLMSGIDLHILDYAMKEINGIFIFKLHPNTKIDIQLSEFENLVVLSNTFDIYPVLPYLQTLITDYSSIYYDFILMEHKNVILYPFDYQSYISQDRDLAYNYFESIEGKIVYDFKDLLEILSNIDMYESFEKIDKIRKVFWSSLKNDNEYIYKKMIEKTN